MLYAYVYNFLHKSKGSSSAVFLKLINNFHLFITIDRVDEILPFYSFSIIIMDQMLYLYIRVREEQVLI